MGAPALAPGSPLPPFGKMLGKLSTEDITTVVEHGIVAYGRFILFNLWSLFLVIRHLFHLVIHN